MGLNKDRVAAQYAKTAHHGQRRKYTGEHYFNHCARVANKVSDFLEQQDITDKYAGVPAKIIIDAAFLHDVLEDTNVTYKQLIDVFGLETAALVDECSNKYTTEAFPDFNRAQRNTLEAIRQGKISKAAQLIKRCDMVDNVSDLIVNDPEYAIKYMKEKIEVLYEMMR